LGATALAEASNRHAASVQDRSPASMAIVDGGAVGVRPSADTAHRVRRGASADLDLRDRKRVQLAHRSFFFTLLGWAFGRTTLIILGHVRRYEKALIVVIVAIMLIVFWLMRKRHVEDEVVEVLAAGDTGPIPKLSRPDDL
jgi:hypothetical protein